MTAALASARAAYAALRALDTEIAQLDALPWRDGFMRERHAQRADLVRIRGRRVTELRTACKEAYAEACEEARRDGMAALKHYRRNMARRAEREFAA